MEKLTGRQRRYLRGLAHGLKPVVQIGKNGLTDSVYESLGEALGHHELIKVRFVDFKDQKRQACEEIDARLGSACVATIGHVAVFYRRAAEPDERKIELPGNPP